MAWVGLQQMKINAPIGYYQQEQKIGNDYWVDVAVKMDLKEPEKDKLANTLNYEAIYELVQSIMQEPKALIETAAWQIGQQALKERKDIEQVKVTITKERPLLKAAGGHSFVAITIPEDR